MQSHAFLQCIDHWHSGTVVQGDTSNKDDVEVPELKAELETSQAARAMLEQQIQDLRKALKATGTPTEACSNWVDCICHFNARR